MNPIEPSDPSEFERRLRDQPLRPVPPEWRDSILRVARASAAAPPARPSVLAQFRALLDRWLWPAPAAWAGVAAVWVVIVALNRSAAFEPGATLAAGQVAPGSAVVALREQRREIEELLEPSASTGDAAAPTPAGRPRSAVVSTNRIA